MIVKGRHILLFVLFISMMSASVQARSITATAEVTFTLLNQEPVITAIMLEPSHPFTDETVRCVVTVDDERPAEVSYRYYWFIDGVPRDVHGGTLEMFEEGSTLTCVAVPEDHVGVQGEPAKGQGRVRITGPATKALDSSLRFLGAEGGLAKAEELQGEGIISITGFAVSQSIANRPEIPALGFLLVMLSLININLFLRRSTVHEDVTS